ncbi:MAG: ABC transporter permease [Aerococcus sp.]|nr:ABC transporter permease [Aerococcus sp.]
MNKVWIVAKETYRRNTLNFSFFMMLLMPLIAIIFFLVIGYFTSDLDEDQPLTVVVSDAPTKQGLEVISEQAGNQLPEIHYVDTTQQAKQAIADDEITSYLAVTTAGDQLKATYYSPAGDENFQTTYPAFTQVLNNYQAMLTLRTLGISPTDYQKLMNQKVPVTNASLATNKVTGSDQSMGQFITFGVALAIMFIVFIYIAVYANLIIQNIADEKGSRIMEILLSTMTATQNFYGKLLGIMLMILTQLFIYALFAGGVFWYYNDEIHQLLASVPSDTWHSIGSAIGWSVVYGVFGIVLYSALAAFIGSLTTKKEDAQKAAGPLSIIQVIGFYIGLFGMMRFSDSVFLKGASHIPLFAANIMPLRIAKGQVSPLKLTISVIVNIIFIALVLHVSLTFYKTNVLSYSEEGVWQTFKRSLTLNRGEHQVK